MQFNARAIESFYDIAETRLYASQRKLQSYRTRVQCIYTYTYKRVVLNPS